MIFKKKEPDYDIVPPPPPYPSFSIPEDEKVPFSLLVKVFLNKLKFQKSIIKKDSDLDELEKELQTLSRKTLNDKPKQELPVESKTKKQQILKPKVKEKINVVEELKNFENQFLEVAKKSKKNLLEKIIPKFHLHLKKEDSKKPKKIDIKQEKAPIVKKKSSKISKHIEKFEKKLDQISVEKQERSFIKKFFTKRSKPTDARISQKEMTTKVPKRLNAKKPIIKEKTPNIKKPIEKFEHELNQISEEKHKEPFIKKFFSKKPKTIPKVSIVKETKPTETIEPIKKTPKKPTIKKEKHHLNIKEEMKHIEQDIISAVKRSELFIEEEWHKFSHLFKKKSQPKKEVINQLEKDIDEMSKKGGKAPKESSSVKKDKKVRKSDQKIKGIFHKEVLTTKKEKKPEMTITELEIEEAIRDLKNKPKDIKLDKTVPKKEEEIEIKEMDFKLDGGPSEPVIKDFKDEVDHIKHRIKKARNALIEFDLDKAKDHYVEIIKIYCDMEGHKQSKVYEHIRDLYDDRKVAEKMHAKT